MRVKGLETSGLVFECRFPGNGDDPYAVLKGCDSTDPDIIIPDRIVVDRHTCVVRGIAPYAFDGNGWVRTVDIPDTVTDIGRQAFMSCSGLLSVTLPESLGWIRKGTFNGCSRLGHVDIPGSVRGISERAFQRCESLEDVVLPDSLTHLGDFAFQEC